MGVFFRQTRGETFNHGARKAEDDNDDHQLQEQPRDDDANFQVVKRTLVDDG